jgi:hypothetical protein
MRSIFQSILGQPLIIPKPFFKNRRNVSVQLTTDPPISEQKPITLQLNEGLVIKFEGLLQMNQGIKSKVFNPMLLLLTLKLTVYNCSFF